MKHFFSIIIIFYMLLLACKKEDNKIQNSKSPDNVSAVAYLYNTATKKFTPQDSITAQIESPAGVKWVYIYLVRSNKTDSVVSIFYAPEGAANTVSMGVSSNVFSKINMSTAKGLKLMIKHQDNTYHEDSIKITPFTPPLPQVQNFPASLVPDNNNIVQVTGKALSQNGIKIIYIYDDATGVFTKVDSITNLNSVTTYDVNYSYKYRDKAGNIKIQVVDNFDLMAEATIKIPVLPYNVYQDVIMNAQGFSTNNAFIVATGTLLGSCDLPLNEATMDFLFYGTSTKPTFYSPANTTNVANNYKCNGSGWVISNPSALKATKFRILTKGSSTAIDNLYTNFTANNIPDLNDTGFFNGIAVPSSSTAGSSSASGDFNTTTAYLIWARIPKTDGTFKNCLIRVKELTSSTGTSVVKIDVYAQK